MHAATSGRRVWARPGHLVLAGGWLLAVLAPGEVLAMRYVPLLASLVVLGLPHGAVDHLIPGWVAGRPLRGRRLAGFLLSYVGCVLIGLVVFLVAPLVAVALFLGLTVVHWGTAELPFFPGQPRGRWFAAARGLIPIVVPALTQPSAFDAGMRMLLGPFVAHPPAVAPTGAVRIVLAGALTVVLVVGAGRGRRALLETAGLVVFFAMVTPVFAIGLYFIAWHSLRHVARLTTVDPAARIRLRDGQPWRAVGVVLWAALPLSGVALAGLATLAIALLASPTNSGRLLAVALAFIASLTAPHTALVLWLDRTDAGDRRAPSVTRPAPSAATRRRPASRRTVDTMPGLRSRRRPPARRRAAVTRTPPTMVPGTTAEDDLPACAGETSSPGTALDTSTVVDMQ